LDQIKSAYRLSHLQQGMLYHYISGDHQGADLEQVICDLLEDLDITALRQAAQSLVARHDVLRTAFDWRKDEPLQSVADGLEAPFEELNWSSCSSGEHSEKLEEFLRSDRRRAFDLSQAPLIRFASIQLGPADYRLILTFPHIILDGRSFPFLIDELFSLYEAQKRGEEASLKARRPYRDFVSWLEGQESATSEGFWRRTLSGISAPTSLAGAVAQPTADDEVRAVCEGFLDPAISAALREATRGRGFTLNNIVQGAWAILLNRWTGEERVIYGATRAGRRFDLDGADEMIGLFINTLPLVVEVDQGARLGDWLKTLSDEQYSVRPHEHTPLVDIARWSDVPAESPLFESIIVFDNQSLDSAMHGLGERHANRRFQLREQTTYPLTLYAYGDDALCLRLSYDKRLFDAETIERVLGQLRTLLEAVPSSLEKDLGQLPLLPSGERDRLLTEWNQTKAPFDRDVSLNQLFERQVETAPQATAVVHGSVTLTYAELNQRANHLAQRLRRLGVGPETLVGIYTDRRPEMVCAVLAVLKAGGAYVPLDPEYPANRVAFMLEDAGIPIVLCQRRLVDSLPASDAAVVIVDEERRAAEPLENPQPGLTSKNAAYVIYTSGSSGTPKGVVIEHRNVVNFFAAMDARLDHDPPGAWLAVTSLSFDISVLELLWTLCRGFKVVLYENEQKAATAPEPPQMQGNIDFSLCFFASDESAMGDEKYRLLMEASRFADRNGFAAVWTPERHFHDFGGLFPNPSVISAAIAAATERIGIRAGSCVLPLHSPLRVTEEWSVVDNLSRGRVGISFASGWQPNDFVLRPDAYQDAKNRMVQDIDVVSRLWRGEAVAFPGHDGQPVDVRIHPRPVQPELPMWLTAAGNPETFALAGRLGAGILTHLLGQSLEELAEKVAVYREAWRAHGHGESGGHVTLMLHTFVGEDAAAVKEIVREPMIAYLSSSVSLLRNVASTFPAFQNRVGGVLDSGDVMEGISEADMRALSEHAFERYYGNSGLFGTPERCLEILSQLADVKIDEVACLVDFGVEPDAVLASLETLDEVKESWRRRSQPETPPSVSELIRANGVTHMQCTPSMARMLLADAEARQAIASLKQLLIGGEAFPTSLARELTSLVQGEVINMYGPTETTIWSTTHGVTETEESVPIGRPIANTQIYLLDEQLRPAPIGAAAEVYIGGAGVAREYLNRPELTAERFILDPFDSEPDARLYRTGDLARYGPQGVIEFLGRADNQVKIRGHRIELGEIERLLEAQPGVREAVVTVRHDLEDDQRIVAYLVANPQTQLSTEDLREVTQAQLPTYMVPSQFVLLDSLPRTPNGKTDRKALPRPDDYIAAPLEEIAADGDLEQSIASIWQEVLRVDKVSVTRNFFDIGGHSLLAVQVHHRLVDRIAPDLSLTDLFRFPTVRALAEHLAGKDAPSGPGEPTSLGRAERRLDAAALRGERRRR